MGAASVGGHKGSPPGWGLLPAAATARAPPGPAAAPCPAARARLTWDPLHRSRTHVSFPHFSPWSGHRRLGVPRPTERCGRPCGCQGAAQSLARCRTWSRAAGARAQPGRLGRTDVPPRHPCPLLSPALPQLSWRVRDGSEEPGVRSWRPDMPPGKSCRGAGSRAIMSA